MLGGVISISALALFPYPRLSAPPAWVESHNLGCAPWSVAIPGLGGNGAPRRFGVCSGGLCSKPQGGGTALPPPPSPPLSSPAQCHPLCALILPAAEDRALAGVPATGALGVHSLCFPHVPGPLKGSPALGCSTLCFGLRLPLPAASWGLQPRHQLPSSVMLPAVPSLSLLSPHRVWPAA